MKLKIVDHRNLLKHYALIQKFWVQTKHVWDQINKFWGF